MSLGLIGLLQFRRAARASALVCVVLFVLSFVQNHLGNKKVLIIYKDNQGNVISKDDVNQQMVNNIRAQGANMDVLDKEPIDVFGKKVDVHGSVEKNDEGKVQNKDDDLVHKEKNVSAKEVDGMHNISEDSKVQKRIHNTNVNDWPLRPTDEAEFIVIKGHETDGRRIVSPHNFTYIINNENICDGDEQLMYLIYVHTAPKNFVKRKAMRETWAKNNLIPEYPSRIVFMLANPYDEEIQKKINEENKIYHDLVQEDYKDDYHNLTYKGIGALKWIHNYCNKTRFIFKSDDDVFLDMFFLFRVLRTKFWDVTRSFIGLVWFKMNVMRDPKICMSWCIMPHELPGVRHYPIYTSGGFWVMTGDIVTEMYETARRTPFFWVDDAYISGIIPRRMGHVNHHDVERFYRYDDKVFEDQYSPQKDMNWFITLTRNYYRLWYISIKTLPKEDRLILLGREKYEALLKDAESKKDNKIK